MKGDDNLNIKKELFKIFLNEKDNYNLYEKIITFVEKVIQDTKGKENAEFYNHVTNLLNSINNAGYEERRSQQIQYLWDIQKQISDEYDEYLP